MSNIILSVGKLNINTIYWIEQTQDNTVVVKIYWHSSLKSTHYLPDNTSAKNWLLNIQKNLKFMENI